MASQARSTDTSLKASIAAFHLQQQAAASQQPQTHPDLTAEAWHSTMQAQRATERLELLALSLHPDQQRDAQAAVARMQKALRQCWDAFMQEGEG